MPNIETLIVVGVVLVAIAAIAFKATRAFKGEGACGCDAGTTNRKSPAQSSCCEGSDSPCDQ